MMKKETSCINTKAIIDYFKHHYDGDHSVLLRDLHPEIDSLSDPEQFLKDPHNWVSCETISKLYERASTLLDDEMAPYKMARYAIEKSSLGYVQQIVVKGFWSCKRCLSHIQKINDKFNRSKKVELVDIKGNEAVIRLHWHSHMKVSKQICLYNQGIYTFMPLVWKGMPLRLKENSCYFDDAPYCEYHLRWPKRNRLYEIYSRFFTSRAVLMETIREMEQDKRIIEQKYIENAKLYSRLQDQMKALKRSQALLSRAEKFSFLGNLAARLAHEIKNPMTAIGTFIQMLPKKYDDEAFRKGFYEIAAEETRRVNNLITELLDLVKTRESHFELSDLHALIDKMILLVSPQSNSKKIQILRLFSPDILHVWMDTEKMKEAVLNILSNAVDFSHEGGMIRIATRQIFNKSGGAGIQIEIKDNGPGIADAVINEIFDPYFTTKHKSTIHSGTGLGLFITHQNIVDHGGTIEVSSKPDQGAEFILTLPQKPYSMDMGSEKNLSSTEVF